MSQPRLSTNNGRLSKISGQILLLFYEQPSASFSVREISKLSGLSKSTVHNHLQRLQDFGVISTQYQWIDSWQNRMYKMFYYIDLIMQSGLVDFLEHELAASAIILFGSIRKGESNSQSDIDIFVECAREKTLNLQKFEKKLGHPIQLFLKTSLWKLPNRLQENVINGVVLKGYIRVT